MTFLKLKPLTQEQLSAVVELDQLCFGGLWTRSGYERELESSCSQLLTLEAASEPGESGLLIAESEILTQASQTADSKARNQESGVKSQEGNLSLPVESKPILNSEFCTLNSERPTAPTPSNALIGLGCYWSILEEAHITILAVHPNYQRQGLGQLLLYALLRDAKRHQLEWATLEVKPSNQAALSLYEKFGFTEAGRRRHYYKDTGEDALILWRGGLQQQNFEETLDNCFRQAMQRLLCCGWQLSDLWGWEMGTNS